MTLTLQPDKPWNRAQPSDVAFHCGQLPAEHLTRPYRLPATTVARTVAGLARTLPFTDAVVVQADGLLKYNDREDLVRQLERDRLLRDAGYQGEHFTWAELFRTPEVVIGGIRRAVTAAAPS